MRLIGVLDPPAARRFADYMLARGVETRLDPVHEPQTESTPKAGSDPEHDDTSDADAAEVSDSELLPETPPEPREVRIWVYDEDRVDDAKAELDQFRENPDASRFREAAEAAADLRKQKERARGVRRQPARTPKERPWGSPAYRRIPVTFITMVLCGILTLAGSFGSSESSDPLWGALTFAPTEQSSSGGTRLVTDGAFDGIARGEVWRLITPALLHGDPIHLLANMFSMFVLGNLVEPLCRRGWYILFLLGLAVGSNALTAWAIGPFSVGISGVAFGLFGYVWFYTRLSPKTRGTVPTNFVVFGLVFFLLCVTGVMGNISNTGHATGLLLGIGVALAVVARERSKLAT